MSAADFVNDLDIATQALLKETRRTHLGASQVGAKCAREPWYGFRHVLDVPFDGRMLRLFDRGKEEEWRFYTWLEAMGIDVRPWVERLCYHGGSDSFASIPWEDEVPMDLEDVSLDKVMVALSIRMGQGPAQWRFEDHDGHYAGSGDGDVLGLGKWFPEIASKGRGLLECKTHGEKSFEELSKKGVQAAKPEHYIQMQEYMHYRQMRWCLYMAVNKNTDHIYVEVVEYRAEVGTAYSDRGLRMIQNQLAPPRISEDPSSFLCRFCDYKRICHYGETPEKNCRSCQYASPGPDKTWVCGLYRNTIPEDFISTGCGKWEPVK